MVSARDLAWQNKSIPGTSDFRGVLIMGLLAAWFYGVGQCLTLPPFAAFTAGLPPLLGSVLAKAQYMPDFGMILAGFAAFHFRREMRMEWNTRVALETYVSTLVTLIAYLAAGVALLEAVHLAGPAHALVPPWQDRWMRVPFLVLATAAAFSVLWPAFLFWMWTAALDVGLVGVVLPLIYFGADFTLGWHREVFMVPVTALQLSAGRVPVHDPVSLRRVSRAGAGPDDHSGLDDDAGLLDPGRPRAVLSRLPHDRGRLRARRTQLVPAGGAGAADLVANRARHRHGSAGPLHGLADLGPGGDRHQLACLLGPRRRGAACRHPALSGHRHADAPPHACHARVRTPEAQGSLPFNRHPPDHRKQSDAAPPTSVRRPSPS
jgi:general stress protein CsbA